MRVAPEASTYIEEVISVMRNQMGNVKSGGRPGVSPARRGPEGVKGGAPQRPPAAKGLRLIYNWYASQHQTYGKNPTFDELSTDANVMDNGSFIRFARDFKLLVERGEQPEDIRTLNKNELIRVFKKHASFQRDLHYDEFIAALDTIADIAIVPDASTEGEQEMDADVKRKRLYAYLKVNKPAEI
jgi:hypothetical protein